MANDILNLVWECAPVLYGRFHFTVREFLILVRLADRAQPEGSESGQYGESWPSINGLAAETNQKPRNTYNGLTKIESLGFIRVRHRPGRPPGRKGTTNHYWVEVDKLQGLVQVIRAESAKETCKAASEKPAKTTPKPATAIADEPSLRTVIEPSCVVAQRRGDSISVPRGMKEAVELWEQSGGRLEIRNDTVWIMEFPPDYKNHPAYPLLKDVGKGKGREELLAFVRSREAEPAPEPAEVF